MKGEKCSRRTKETNREHLATGQIWLISRKDDPYCVERFLDAICNGAWGTNMMAPDDEYSIRLIDAQKR